MGAQSAAPHPLGTNMGTKRGAEPLSARAQRRHHGHLRQGGLQAANSIFSSEGTPQCTLYPGSCFHAPSIVPSGVLWTSDAMSSYASLSVDNDMLRRLHATFPTSTSAPAAVRA